MPTVLRRVTSTGSLPFENRKRCRQTGSRQSTPLSTIRTRYGNSVSKTPEATRTCLNLWVRIPAPKLREADTECQYRPHNVDADIDCGRHFCGRHFRDSHTPEKPRIWEPPDQAQRSPGPFGPEPQKGCGPRRGAPPRFERFSCHNAHFMVYTVRLKRSPNSSEFAESSGICKPNCK